MLSFVLKLSKPFLALVSFMSLVQASSRLVLYKFLYLLAVTHKLLF